MEMMLTADDEGSKTIHAVCCVEGSMVAWKGSKRHLGYIATNFHSGEGKEFVQMCIMIIGNLMC